MDPVSLFMAATAAFNTVKKLVEAGREVEDVLGQIGSWMGKVSELNALDNKKPSIFKRIGGGKSIEQEAMEQLQRREAVRKQHLELMSMVKLRYGPSAFDELMQMQRQIKLKRERELIHQAQRRKDVVMYCLLAVVLAVGIWAIWGMVATAIEWKQNGI
uniref:hypothetical protein n=1 Tax=Shewanella sp. TaxID=50422 RepID=UPI004048BCBA